MEGRVRGLVHTHLFRFCKFIKGEAEEDRVADKIYDLVFTTDEQKDKDKEHKSNWRMAYGEFITKVLNDRRSYLQQRMKDSLCDFHKEAGIFPSLEEIHKCATRTVDLDNDWELKIFTWYWTDLMGTCKFGHHVLLQLTHTHT